MNAPALLGGLGLVAAALAAAPVTEVKVLAGGAAEGYLSPCGCVKPMSGGIRRKATAVKRILDANTVYVEIGPLVADAQRQSELKADALAETMKLMHVDAVGLTHKDGVLSAGALEAFNRLSGQKLLASQLTSNFSKPTARSKGWLIGAVSMSPNFGKAWGLRARPVGETVANLVKEARSAKLRPLLLLDGSRSDAAKLLERHAINTVLCLDSHAGAWAGPKGRRIMATGEKAKQLILASSQKKPVVFDLGPQYADDPSVAQVFNRYQSRIQNEQLLERMPRTRGDAFAGNSSCMSCHSKAHDVWKDSRHAGALATLEKVGQDRDPDCTGCHVVGLDKVLGFKSRQQTPELADVSCESCHGPARKHVENPMENSLPKVGEKSCMPCHNVAHSPQFDFKSYWLKIAH